MPSAAAGFYEVCDLDGSPAPPAAKRARRAKWAHASLPGILPAILGDHELMTRWRRDIHANPELGFEESRTADMVAKLLRRWGVDVSVGAVGGPTAVIGTLRGSTASSNCIGLRADLDALPTQEVSDETESSREHTSKNNGVHHGCGHDGHTAMLLGAAKYLAATREFSGTVHFIFQPNEEAVVNTTKYKEGASGGELMVAQGLFDKFHCDQVYGMHNWPALEAGKVGVRPGAIMGSEDNFIIIVKGKSGHGAMPHLCVDPLLVGCRIVSALQSIVSREADPVDAIVVSVTQFNAGSAFNVTPERAELRGTLRTFCPDVRALARRRIREIAQGVATAFGATIDFELIAGYPPTLNDPTKAKLAAEVASRIVGEENVIEPKPSVASEDFAFLLGARPGCYLWLGNRSQRCTANLHECHYDFNDDVLPIGASIFASLVERLQPPSESSW